MSDIMKRRREKADSDAARKAMKSLAERDDKIGRLCRMMLDEDDCETYTGDE